jgi:hypothetical protein
VRILVQALTAGELEDVREAEAQPKEKEAPKVATAPKAAVPKAVVPRHKAERSMGSLPDKM